MEQNNKNERILIAVAILMFAAIIGYNAFFIPEIPNYVEIASETNIGELMDKLKGAPESVGPVNINTAGREDLQTLNGVGPAIASRIIEYREANGGFADIEEIKEVKGIGEKVFEKIKDYIKVQ